MVLRGQNVVLFMKNKGCKIILVKMAIIKNREKRVMVKGHTQKLICMIKIYMAGSKVHDGPWPSSKLNTSLVD